MTADGSDRSFGAPRFDVVLRGYDRRQVDEHLARLQRLLGRMRSDLDAARSQPASPMSAGGPPTPVGGRPRPTPRPRPDGSPPTGAQDVVGTFTDRMHAILQAAEEEAAEIRHKARATARAEEERAAALRATTRAEEETARRTLADLVRQRDAVLAELTRVRGQLEGLLSGPTTRITLPTQEGGPERREVGAGQPLPGTPEPAPADDPVVVPPGFPPAEPAPTGTASAPGARTATGTAILPVPGAPSPSEPAAPVAGRAGSSAEPDVSPAEETALMEPVTDEPDGSAPESTPVEAGAAEPVAERTSVEPTSVESTQAVEPPGRAGDGADDTDGDGPPRAVDAPTQVARARSG